MESRRKWLSVFIVVSLLSGVLVIAGDVNAGVVQQAKSDTVPVFDFQDHGGVIIMNPQERGTSDLVRTVDGISMNIDTTDLPVGAYTLWWVIFNDPSMCSDGECGENDVLPPPGTPEAGVSPLWATGGIVGPDRMSHFSASLGLGLEGAQGQVLWGDGLTDIDCCVEAIPQSNFSDANRKLHPSQKPVKVMRWLAATLTHEGEMIVDPFCGGGSTGVAAVQLGRRFVGIETNKEYRRIASERIAAYGEAKQIEVGHA